MQTYISDIIPSISRYSKQLNDETLLTSRHWVVIDEIVNRKNIYIFRKNRDLLISTNGLVEKGTWDYLGNEKILIEQNGKDFLFRHGFFEDDFLALKIEGGDEYAFLVNEKKYDENLNSVMSINTFLTKKYIDSPVVIPGGEVNEHWMMFMVTIIILFCAIIILFSVDFKP
jgi:hypothetical protein